MKTRSKEASQLINKLENLVLAEGAHAVDRRMTRQSLRLKEKHQKMSLNTFENVRNQFDSSQYDEVSSKEGIIVLQLFNFLSEYRNY